MSWLTKRRWTEKELLSHIGHSNRELLEMTQLRAPDADGREVALAVLGLLLPDRDSKQWHAATELVNQMIDQNPSNNTSRHSYGMTGHRINDNEGKDMEWVGIAVLAATMCGAAALWLRGQRGNKSDLSSRRPHTSPAPAPNLVVPAQDTVETVRLAAAVLSGKARETGTAAEQSVDLFSMAMFWWSGSASAWDQTVSSAGLSPLRPLPASDDVLLVSVYETELPRSAMPTTRVESSAILRNAARDGQLRHIETYGIPPGTKLTQFGFTR